MVEVGKRVYLLSHAYHHFIGEVVEITGKREVTLKNVIRVQSCNRGWTEFFRDGLGADTTYTHFPDGTISYFAAFEWHHDIPEAPRATRRR